MKPTKLRYLATVLPAIVGFLAFVLPTAAPAQSLVNRYSFGDAAGSSTFVDSISGANGTLQQGISSNPNSAYLNGSQLVLDGTGGYGLLPGGLISSQTQVTIEFWASYTTNLVWTRSFAFGDQASGNEDAGLDYTHYAGGNYENLNYQTNNANPGDYVNNPGGLDGQSNVHVTVVVDPIHNTMYYYNGTVIKSSPLQGGAGTVFPLNQLTDTDGLIGRSLYDVDPTLAGSIDEFRIYGGVLTSSNVVLNDAAGPNTIINGTGGALTAIHLISPINPMVIGQDPQQLLKGDFPNISGVDLLAFGTNGGSVAVFSSGNPGVLSVNSSSGLATAISSGTATVIASYGTFSATNTLTVAAIPAILTHRYSFTADASDSIGGANGTYNGDASVSGGQLVLDGTPGTYLSLPGNAININTNSAITLEAWATVAPGNGTWGRLFEFGDGNGGADLYCAPQINGGASNDHRCISENFGNGSQTIDEAPSWDGTTLHHVWIIDPNTSRLESYVNGVLEFSVQDATAAISSISTNVVWLGHSPFSADPYLQGSIDEFRIYSGALTPQEIAVSDLSGPNSTNREPGALVSLSVPSRTVPAFSGMFAPSILASYANLTNFSLIANASAAPVVGLTLTSSDPAVLTLVGNNMLQTLRPGTVTLTATYQGKTASGTITVENRAVLEHRYSFTTDASDSIGGADGTNNGDANETGGQLVLDGTAGTYVSLPANLLSNYDAVTIDTWTTLNSAQNWGRLFFFGDYENNEFYVCPDSTGSAHRISSGVYDGATADDPPEWQNQTIHITTIYGNGSLELYSNGVPVRVFNNIIGPLSQVGESLAWIGQSPYPADPYMNCSVDEFRIYKGRLAPEEIAASDVIGPDQLLSTQATMGVSLSGGNTVISWPVAAAGFSLQTSTSLKSGSWNTLTNPPTLTGNTNWQIIVPISGSQQFYRLWR